MTPSLICADVGATNTRLALYDHAAEDASPRVFERPVESVEALEALLVASIGELPEPPVFVGGFAGPVRKEGLRMTNWEGDARIETGRLRALGLREVHLLNDLEAAAHGLVDLLEGAPAPEVVVPVGGPDPDSLGPRVLLMPGTGLGSATLLACGEGRWHIVPGEGQHQPAFALTAFERGLLDRLATRSGRPTTWDDLVSGRGLEAIYEAISGERQPAGVVSGRAGTDARARRALEQFYAFAGSYGQTLALAVRATGGVYLAGSSTRANLEIARDGPLATRLRQSEPMAHLLGDVPVLLVTAELNLRGARAYARISRS